MKKRLVLITLGAITLTTSPVHARLIWHDSFGYASTGSQISTAGSPSWYQYATVTDPTIAAGSLSYPGLQTGPGSNSVLFTGTGTPYTGIAMRALDAVYTINEITTLYYSLTFQVTSVTPADWGGSANWLTGSFMMGFDQEASGALAQGDVAAPLLVRTGDPDNTSGSADNYQGFQLGTGVTAASATRAFDATHTYEPGTTLFLVLSYTFVDGADNDVARLYVNPPLGSPESSNSPVVTVTGVADVINNQIQSVLLRHNSVEPGGTLIDDLRIGTTWADVTPPAQVVSPSLRILPAATDVQFRWPVNRRGFVLEESTNLGPSAVWTIITNNVSVSFNDFVASPAASAGAKFFRLRGAFLPGVIVESPHFGYNSGAPEMTEVLRLSDRTGLNWWSLNTPRTNVENGAALPYAYHDGYVELIGSTHTSAEAAERWHMILHGQGDPWTGASAASIGAPSIILLDEVTTAFKDTGQGPAFREALRLYLTSHSGSRDDIIAYASRSVSLTSINSQYGSLIFCANNYLRFLALELYATQEGYVTGYERDQPSVFRGTNDTYLIDRYATPIRRWTAAGVSAERLIPILTVSNYGDANGTTTKPFYKFLNRQFWVLANGWYTDDHFGVDTNIQHVLRNGVGSYTWTPGTNSWNLVSTETNLDARFEAYLKWYCVDGRLDPHPDGVDAGPN